MQCSSDRFDSHNGISTAARDEHAKTVSDGIGMGLTLLKEDMGCRVRKLHLSSGGPVFGVNLPHMEWRAPSFRQMGRSTKSPEQVCVWK